MRAGPGGLGNAVTQGIGVATGLQDSFDWTGVAVGAIVGVAGGATGRYADARGWAPLDSVQNSAVSGVASALAGAATRSALDGTRFGDNILAALPDVIGQTVGNAVAGGIQQANLNRRAEALLDHLDLPKDRETNRATYDFARNLVADGRASQPEMAAILLNPSIADALLRGDMARAGYSDAEIETAVQQFVQSDPIGDWDGPTLDLEALAAHYDPSAPLPVEIEINEAVLIGGPDGFNVTQNLLGSGVSFVNGLVELEADHPILANIAYEAGQTIFTGGPVKKVVTSIVQAGLSGVGDQIAGGAQRATERFVTDLAQKYNLSIGFSIGDRSGEIGGSLFGMAAGNLAGVVVSMGLGGSLGSVTDRGRDTVNNVNRAWRDKFAHDANGTILDRAQRTGSRTLLDTAHQRATYREAVRLARDPDVVSVRLNRGYNSALDLQPGTIRSNRRPDVTAVYSDGRMARVEVMSGSDQVAPLRDRNEALDPQIRAQGFDPLVPEVVRPNPDRPRNPRRY